MAFAVTSFVLSCYDAAIWGIQVDSPPNVVTGLLLFYGGVTLGLAGVWEYALARNTHGGIGFVCRRFLSGVRRHRLGPRLRGAASLRTSPYKKH
jgi:hypothetical protein